ncbi:MAG: hypothetical protein C0184_11180, partial [Chloroflexus aggregans]
LGMVLILGGLGWLLFELLIRGTIAGIDLNLARSDSVQRIAEQRFIVKRVEVVGVNDQVVLIGTTDDEVVLRGERRGFGWAANAAADAATKIELQIEQRGDTLYINVKHPQWAPWSFGRNPYAYLELALPSDVTFEVSLVSGDATLRQVAARGTITTINGEVRAEGTTGQLTLNTTSGDVTLSDHRSEINFLTVSGDLSASGLLGAVIAQTTSGDVKLSGVRGPVQVTTVSGDVDIASDEAVRLAIDTTGGDITFSGRLAAGEQHVSTISGDVQLTLLPPFDVQLNFRTIGGKIDAPAGLAAQVSNARSLQTMLGDGRSLLNVEATSGNITLRLAEQ